MDRYTSIGINDRELALRAFAWLLYCQQCPLKVHFLATAASIIPDEQFFIDQRVDDDDILEVCRSLIDVNRVTGVVELSHFSVKQFLQMPTVNGMPNWCHIDEARGNAILMRCCFMYLRSPVVVEPLVPETLSPDLQQLATIFRDPFIFYAIFHWPIHARKVIHDEQCMDDVYAFMQNAELTNSHDPLEESAFNVTRERHNSPKAFRFWCKFWESEILRNHPWWDYDDEDNLYEQDWLEGIALDIRKDNMGCPLYYSALVGLPPVIQKLLDLNDELSNCFGGCFPYPLLAAVRQGHLSSVATLLDRGADIDISDPQSKDTSLHVAIANDNLEMVKLFVQRDASLSTCNATGDPPLHLAVRKLSHTWSNIGSDLVKVLAVQANVKDQRGETALHRAVSLKSEPVARLLLERNAKVDETNWQGRSPMHFYAETGDRHPIFELLSSKNANLDLEDRLGYTPLHLAVMKGKWDMTEAILGQTLARPRDAGVRQVAEAVSDLTSRTPCLNSF